VLWKELMMRCTKTFVILVLLGAFTTLISGMLVDADLLTLSAFNCDHFVQDNVAIQEGR
jgi:hypothetical protein